MKETQDAHIQRSGLAQLRSLCDQIVQTESELRDRDMIQDFFKPLYNILIELELFEWFSEALDSCRPPETRKRSNRGKRSTRKPPATEVGSMISMDDKNKKNDRHPLRRTSGETRSLDVHPRPENSTADAEKEEGSSRETTDRYKHIEFYARLEKISDTKKNPRTLLEGLCPADKDRLRGSDLQELLNYRCIHGLSDEVLFRYYESARSLNESYFKLRTVSLEVPRTPSTNRKTPQWHVLESLQRTSKQATETVLESRYCKLALYCQVENIRKELELCGKSTPGVSFRTMALREWIKRTGDFELEKDSVKLWREQGEKWKTLCDKFTLGILEASHEAPDAW